MRDCLRVNNARLLHGICCADETKYTTYLNCQFFLKVFFASPPAPLPLERGELYV